MEVFVEDESDKPPKKQISAYECYKGNHFSFNPLGPKSVQHQFSPNNSSRSTRVKVMRITKLMTKGRIL